MAETKADPEAGARAPRLSQSKEVWQDHASGMEWSTHRSQESFLRGRGMAGP